MGFKDKCGEIKNIHSSDNEYMNDCIHFLNSTARKTSTYKYAFFKSILDNLFNVNDNFHLKFETLSKSFSIIYWNLISRYKLPQFQNQKEKSSKIETSIYSFLKKDPLVDGVEFDSLKKEIQDKYLEDTDDIISEYVVGALYSDLNENIYGFDKEQKIIWFNKESYNFLVNYKSSLEKLNYYAWIIWTENILDNSKKEIGNIASKLDNSTKRESLESFKNDLINNGEPLTCFYCGKSLKTNKIHVDHFVPWKFVKDDQLWNFVLTCDHCNTSKNDKIPIRKYLDKIIKRNEGMFNPSYDEIITLLYNSALHNGFALWERKNDE